MGATAVGGEKNRDKCGSCKTLIITDDMAMQCEVCEIWCCVSCEGMLEELYNYSTNNGDQIVCYCAHCSRGNKNIHKLIKNIDE